MAIMDSPRDIAFGYNLLRAMKPFLEGGFPKAMV
jgi:hypothetical protein